MSLVSVGIHKTVASMQKSTSSLEEEDEEEAYQRHLENSDDLRTSNSSGNDDASLSEGTSTQSDGEDTPSREEEENYSLLGLPLGERARLTIHSQLSHNHTLVDLKNTRENKNGRKQKQAFAREHKHRPVEMSSKQPVSVLRDSTLGLGDGSGIMKKKRIRDPRFDSLSGNYSETAFKKRFSFIFDEKIPEEQRDIKQSLSKVKSSTKKEKLERKLQKLQQQLKTEEARRKQEARKQKVMDRHREATKGQTTKYHLKKSEIKKQELLLKYEELRDNGSLERYMEKRRKKNAAKDHRYLPYSRE